MREGSGEQRRKRRERGGDQKREKNQEAKMAELYGNLKLGEGKGSPALGLRGLGWGVG